MVKGQGKAPVAGIDDDRGLGVVSALGIARSPGEEDSRDRVEAGIAGGIRIGAELADELDLERRLLAGLADGGGLERLAVFDEAARERPAGRRVLPLDDDDPPPLTAIHDLDDDIDGRERVTELGAGHFQV